MEEENRNLLAEIQRLRNYGHRDMEQIQDLENRLCTERQLRIAEGLAQAAQMQRDRSGWGPPPTRDRREDEYQRDLRRASEDSQ